jgi:hypothetical protein
MSNHLRSKASGREAAEHRSTNGFSLQRVLEALHEGHPHQAARRLAGGALDDRLPEGRALAAWLTRGIGPKATRQVVDAFADYPCFVCRGGLELCETCRGSRRIRGELCEHCIGLGAMICRFCGGSGWVTINFVPRGLRSLVIDRRLRLARGLIAELVDEHRAARGRSTGAAGKSAQKSFGAVVVRWNRIMAILENAIVALRLSCSREPLPAQLRLRWILQAARLGKRADQHVRHALKTQAETCGTDSEEAGFYLDLAVNPAMSSELEHPFLRRAIRAAQHAAKIGGSRRAGRRRRNHTPRMPFNSVAP